LQYVAGAQSQLTNQLLADVNVTARGVVTGLSAPDEACPLTRDVQDSFDSSFGNGRSVAA
jgi:hypothetical protein